MTAKQKMIAIVGDAIVRTLTHYGNTTPDLSDSVVRFKIAQEILDRIMNVLNDPRFKNAK